MVRRVCVLPCTGFCCGRFGLLACAVYEPGVAGFAPDGLGERGLFPALLPEPTACVDFLAGFP